MIAASMLLATLAAVIVGAAALATDAVARVRRWPRRWIWVAALALSVAVPARWVLLPDERPARPASPAEPAPAPARRALAGSTPGAWLADLLARARPGTARLTTIPAVVDEALAALWAGGSAAVLLAFVAAGRTLARRRRRWRESTLDGVRVLVSPDLGPAVVGAARPRIVLPEWALALPPAERALMLGHEREHVRARDPLLLHLAAVAVVAMPWNVAVWGMLRRLRLAVELDCDRRVLEAGGDAARYGSLLLAVGERRSRGVPALAPALLERTSFLAVRITAMHPRRPRFPRVHAALCATVATALIVVACETPPPEVIAPDGTEKAAVRLYGSAPPTPTAHAPDSLRAEVARLFPEVASGAAGPSLLIMVQDDQGRLLATERKAWDQPIREPARSGDSTAPAPAGTGARPARTPLAVMADGDDLLGRVDRETIDRVEVVKHAAGTLGPQPVSVIWITLKAGASLRATGAAPR